MYAGELDHRLNEWFDARMGPVPIKNRAKKNL